jgi:hypothetical protein
MKHAAEMGSGAMIHIPNLLNIGSGIQKLKGGEIYGHGQHEDCISLFYFLK